MHSRIKELEPQCWEHNEFGLNFNYQQFAELIIQECAEIADQAEPYKAADLIKQRFGVQMRKIELDGDIADRIALLVLEEHRDLLQEQLTKWQKDPTGYYLHADDVVGNMQLVTALDLLIKYFGGKDET